MPLGMLGPQTCAPWTAHAVEGSVPGFLVPAAYIEWLQASGNYVNLRVRGHEYPLRSTMATIEQQLDPARFVRVHRSHMVNLDCIAQIEPLDTGDARVVLRDGTVVPCSRRYRDALRPANA